MLSDCRGQHSDFPPYFFKTLRPVLGRDEELALITEAQTGNRDALTKLIEHNQGMVVTVSQRYTSQLQGLEFADLMQWGNIGLLEAIRRFDTKSGYRLSTFAMWHIRAQVQRNAHLHGGRFGISYSGAENLRMVNKAVASLTQKNRGKKPTDEQVIKEAGISPLAYKRIAPLMRGVLSLDEISEGGDRDRLADNLAADPEDSNAEENEKAVMIALGALSELTRGLIIQRYGLDGNPPVSKANLAKRTGKSYSAISKLLDKGLKEMRLALQRAGLD